LERRFWDDLLRDARDWGLITYEQDWLYTEFISLNATWQSATLGTRSAVWIMLSFAAVCESIFLLQLASGCCKWERQPVTLD